MSYPTVHERENRRLIAENAELQKRLESIGVWADCQALEAALRNILMLARREKRRTDTDLRTLAAWAHVLHFCDEAGVESDGILRGAK
jgi:hypothetical protein